jgi:hypothetical protein
LPFDHFLIHRNRFSGIGWEREVDYRQRIAVIAGVFDALQFRHVIFKQVREAFERRERPVDGFDLFEPRAKSVHVSINKRADRFPGDSFRPVG